MIIPTPMPLGQQSKPFDDPDWLYEIKHDGFRALALIDRGHCWFVSRRKHKFHGFRDLAAALVREVNAEVAVLDGELAVPDQTGRTVFAAMMKHRQQVRFYAFDLLYLNGEDSANCHCSHEKKSSNAFCLPDLPICCMSITRRAPATACMNWPASWI
jgi:bifunctional non-homologous end joining protein LigD